MRHNHPKGPGFFMGAIVGGVLTAMTAVFFKSKKGTKVKHDAVAKYEDVVEKCGDIKGIAKKMMNPKMKAKMKKKTKKHRRK